MSIKARQQRLDARVERNRVSIATANEREAINWLRDENREVTEALVAQLLSGALSTSKSNKTAVDEAVKSLRQAQNKFDQYAISVQSEIRNNPERRSQIFERFKTAVSDSLEKAKNSGGLLHAGLIIGKDGHLSLGESQARFAKKLARKRRLAVTDPIIQGDATLAALNERNAAFEQAIKSTSSGPPIALGLWMLTATMAMNEINSAEDYRVETINQLALIASGEATRRIANALLSNAIRALIPLLGIRSAAALIALLTIKWILIAIAVVLAGVAILHVLRPYLPDDLFDEPQKLHPNPNSNPLKARAERRRLALEEAKNRNAGEAD